MEETRWWTFFLMVIQANMVDLSFSSASQLVTLSFFCGFNKINFFVMIIVLFSLLIYSICFYSLCNVTLYIHTLEFCYNGTQSANPMATIYSQLIFPFRILIRSLVHGLFIQNFCNQISLLLFFDVIFAGFVFHTRKTFKSVFIFWFSLIYSVTFIILDTFILSELLFNKKYQYREVFAAAAILTLIFCSFLLFLALILSQIYFRVKWIQHQLQNKNSVLPTSKSTLQKIRIARILRRSRNSSKLFAYPTQVFIAKPKFSDLQKSNAPTKKNVIKMEKDINLRLCFKKMRKSKNFSQLYGNNEAPDFFPDHESIA